MGASEKKPKIKMKGVGIEGLGPLGADILQIVWKRDKITVREVYEELRMDRRIAYTTVMTTMNNMAKKGLLHQDKSANTYIYSAAYENTEIANSIADKVVDKLLGGVSAPLVSHLLGLRKEEDLKEILRLKKECEEKKAN